MRRRGEHLILPDFLLVSALTIFTILWLSDLLITRKTVAAMGESAEVNPIMRKLLTKKDRYLYIIKFIELSAFSYLVYYVSTFAGKAAFQILLVYIFIFGLIVANNARIYHRITNKFSNIFLATFVILLIISVSFIYLNHSLFGDLQNAYDELDDCRQNVTSLEAECGEIDTQEEGATFESESTTKQIVLTPGGSL